VASTWDEWFGTRRWRIATEYSGIWVTEEGSEVVFDKGAFTCSSPAAYQSPVSANLGRRGWLLQEVSKQGRDIADSQAAFGEAAVERARKQYHAIVG
jgi:hypothetical protein